MNKTFAALFALVGVAALAFVLWQVLADEPTEPTADLAVLTLENNTWRLTDLGGEAPTVGATLSIDGAGQVNGQAPCNRYSGTATIGAGSVSFGPLAATRMMCDQLPLETRYLGALATVAGYRIDGTTLELSDGAGQVVLVFEHVQ